MSEKFHINSWRELPYRQLFVLCALGIAGFGFPLGAFSRASIRHIRERDEGCTVGDGCRGPLQAAHINHDPHYEGYNSPENGRVLCMEHHYDDHVTRAGANGLAPEDNWKAINSLSTQLEQYE